MENWSFLSDKHGIIICAVIAIMVSNRHCFLIFFGFLFLCYDGWDMIDRCASSMLSEDDSSVKKEAKSVLSLYTGEYSVYCCFGLYLIESCDQTASWICFILSGFTDLLFLFS